MVVQPLTGRRRPLKSSSRGELIARMRNRLDAPRFQVLVIISIAGYAAFLVSVGCLRLGMGSMALRYPLAALGGYLAFLVMIRAWIAWQRLSTDFVPDTLPNVDGVSVAGRGSEIGDSPLFAGGRSGGAGGGGSWGGTRAGLASSRSSTGGSGVSDLDFDDLWPLVIAAVCVVGGVVAVGYVIYAAPLLLAEIALDAAVVSALYRRLRREDASHWAVTTLRRTWMPALAIIIFAALGGLALQSLAPEAQSIGGVLRALEE